MGAPQAAGDTSAGLVDRERVAQRAYELYLARGSSDGQAMDDWLTAERELLEGRKKEGGRGTPGSGVSES